MRLTSILIGSMFGIIMITAFMQLFSSLSSDYALTGYNESEITHITNQLDAMTNTSIKTKELADSVKGNPSIPDMLGVIVVVGIGGVKTALQSVTSFISITGESINFLPLGNLSDVLLIVMVSSIILILFIAILAHYLRPSDRL